MDCCRVGVGKGRHIEGKIDSTTHFHLDQEEECMDDDDIIGVYTVCDVVCDSSVSQLIRQLVEKYKIVD
jgi:hypothetical protein